MKRPSNEGEDAPEDAADASDLWNEVDHKLDVLSKSVTKWKEEWGDPPLWHDHVISSKPRIMVDDVQEKMRIGHDLKIRFQAVRTKVCANLDRLHLFPGELEEIWEDVSLGLEVCAAGMSMCASILYTMGGGTEDTGDEESD